MSEMAPMDPHDYAGWFVVILGIVATIAAFAIAIKVSIWPGERSPDHPKLLVLREDR